MEEIKESWKRAHSVLIAFGSPKEGLRKILKREGFKMGKIKKLIINTIPLQGTETVRMEEALYSTLAIINVIV
jgi:predicted SPOUT superfamily RNA methylase MTH1